MANISSNVKVLNFTNVDVDEWNNELAKGLTLNSVILSLYIVLGIFGNMTVIFIYGLRMKGETEDRYFIPYLAVVDLLASCVSASFGIALNMMQAKFDNFRLCKMSWFLSGFTTLTSILFLLIIAVHRYLKVCKPLDKQMTLKWKRFAMFLAIFIAFILSVPMTEFYGSVSFPNPERGITGLRCSKIKDENRMWSLVFSAVLGLIVVASVASLIGLYGKIGYTIFTHFRKMKTYSQENKQNHDVNRKIKHKFSLMFILITLIFLLCYVPKVVIMFFEAMNPKFWETFSDNARAKLLFVYRMYIINNISNPFIYAFMDERFSQELKNPFIKCKKR